MSPEQQKIAIAEACGWVREYADVPTWDAPLKSYKIVSTLFFRREAKCVLAENLPDYLNDLNAMHAAENSLTPKLRNIYVDLLGTTFYDSWVFATATAAQRAEAFLRTIGKWEGAQ